MPSRTIYEVFYYPTFKVIAVYESKSLSDKDLQIFCDLLCGPGRFWLPVFDDLTKMEKFRKLVGQIARHFFGNNKKLAADALRKHLINAGLDLPKFIQSLQAIPLEADREVAFEKYVNDVWRGFSQFYIDLITKP